MMERAGFDRATYTLLGAGTVALHRGVRRA